MGEEGKTPIPENIKKSLNKLATATKTDVKELVKQMKEIMEKDPTIQQMANKQHQIVFAHTMLVRRYTMTGGAKQMYLRPLAKPRARQAKSQGKMKYVGDLYALVQIIEKGEDGNETVGETKYAAGTLWERAADVMRELSPNKVYRTSLGAKDGLKGLVLSGNDASFVEVEHEIPTKENFFKSDIESVVDSLIVPLNELNLNNKDDATDYRIVKGIVLATSTGESDKMGEFGLYSITDDSYIGKENFPVFMHPEDIEWGMGTNLYLIGTVDHDAKSKTTRFNCHFVVPEPGSIPIPRSEEPKPAEQQLPSEEVSLDEIGDELESETSTEEKPVEEPKKEETTEKPTEEISDDDFAI